MLSEPQTRRPFGRRMRRDTAHANRQPSRCRDAGPNAAAVCNLPLTSVSVGRNPNHPAPIVRRHNFCGADS